jgi:hypothetical protein
LVADYVGNGIVAYWVEPNALAVVTAAGIAIEKGVNQKLLRPRNWNLGDSSYQPAYVIDYESYCGKALIVFGGVLIVATIVEDASVVGVVDDIITLPIGYLLVNYGNKLAVIVPNS